MTEGSPPREPRPGTPNQPPPMTRRNSIRNGAARVRDVMRARVLNYNEPRAVNVRYTNADRANVNRVNYENASLNTNAIDMISREPFKVGDRVVRYGRGKYMKMKDFAVYLRTSKGGGTTLGSFLRANGNRTFLSPESIRFRRADVKFFKFS
jgi:hypothetical protein